MLVRFDHLTLVVNRSAVEKTIEEYSGKGYKLTIKEDSAINMPTKLNFMKFKDLTHGLYFLEAPEGKGLSVELIAYEHTSLGQSFIQYTLGENTMTVFSEDTDECCAFLSALGCEKSGGDLIFNGVLDPNPYVIHIERGGSLSMSLDNEGFCCPTIFVKPGSKTKASLENAGFFCTEPDTFSIGEKSMFVFFAQGKCGEIFEIVCNKL